MFLPYFNRAFVRIAAWTDSMMSIDRLICVVFPDRFNLISNKKFVFKTVIALTILQLTLNAPNLFFGIKNETVLNSLLNRTQTIRLCTAAANLVLVRDVLDELVRSVVPLIIQVSSSVIIIYKLTKSRNNVARSSSKEDRRFAITIVLLNVFFFLTQTPELLATVYLFSTGATKSSIITTRSQAAAFLIYLSLVAFAGLEYILVFFINIASNRIYRGVFFKILNRIIGKENINNSAQSGTNN